MSAILISIRVFIIIVIIIMEMCTVDVGVSDVFSSGKRYNGTDCVIWGIFFLIKNNIVI